ncbi:MAG TPA: hypothetical protein VK611_21535 [Acidimicrobiales bacterium]|nr:hypothetical protein [Acidimicrobiales bacterium]
MASNHHGDPTDTGTQHDEPTVHGPVPRAAPPRWVEDLRVLLRVEVNDGSLDADRATNTYLIDVIDDTGGRALHLTLDCATHLIESLRGRLRIAAEMKADPHHPVNA